MFLALPRPSSGVYNLQTSKISTTAADIYDHPLTKNELTEISGKYKNISMDHLLACW